MKPPLAVALCLLASLIVSAQAPNTRAARVVEQIGQEADARSQVMELARELTDSYGPRLTGSPHMKAAGDFVIRRLGEFGVKDARFERWGPFGPGWTTDRFVALAVAPAPFPLQAYPKAWTPGTAGEVVAEAVLATIASAADFAAYRGKLRDKFVLTQPVAGASSPAQLEFARRRMAFFLEEGALALLEPGGPAGSVVVTDGRLRDDAAFGGNGFYPWPDPVAAQVVLATEHYNRLARMIEAGSPVTLELNVANAYHPAEPDSFNIVAEIPGTDRRSEMVVVGAHVDSWHAATGALDNAAGSAVVLDAMRILSALRLEMRRTVRLVLWTGSEQGLLGSRFYVAEQFADPAVMQPKPAHAHVSGYINLDGGTGAIRAVQVQGNDGARAALQGWLESVKDFGVTAVGLETTSASDHAAFDAVGLPALDLIQEAGEYATVRHTSADTFDRLQRPALVRNAAVVASLVYYLATRDDLLPRKPLPKPDPKAAGPWSPGR